MIGRGRDQGAHRVGSQVLRERGTFALGRLLQIGPFGVHVARASPAWKGGRHGPECNKRAKFVAQLTGPIDIML